jgi:hypothetical protein
MTEVVYEREKDKNDLLGSYRPFAAFMVLSSVPDVIQHPKAVEIVVTHLGYPSYFLPFLGLAKLLGVLWRYFSRVFRDLKSGLMLVLHSI